MKIIFLSLVFSLFSQFALAQEKMDLVQQIEDSTKLLLQLSGDPQKLEIEFRNVYQFLLNVDPENYDIRELRRNTNHIVYKLATLRNSIRDHIESWKSKGIMTAQFEKELRAMIRATHYLTDYVAEISMDYQTVAKGQRARKAFSAGAPWTNTLDGQPMNFENFKSGDIILMRGGSAVSAAIARIADQKSVFSHVAIVYVDEKTKEKFLIESLIDSGVVINPLAKALEVSAARMSLMRPVDQELGHRAAQIGYDLVMDSFKRGKPFLYDFTMSMDKPDMNNLDNLKMPCTKVLSWFYDLASQGQMTVPFLLSRMDPKNRTFLDRLQISEQTKAIFAPGDMDLEPTSRFKTIAEFREPQRTAGLRTDDLIFDKIFEWMERDGLVFSEPLIYKLIGSTAHYASHISAIRKLAQVLHLGIAPHMPPEVISTVIMLQLMRDSVLEAITPEMVKYQKEKGFPATPKVVYTLLEQTYKKNPEQLKFLVKSGGAKSCRVATSN